MGKVHEKGLFPKTLLETGNAQGTQISGTLRKLWAHTRPTVTVGHALTAAPFSWQCWQASSCGCLLPLQHRARSNFPSWLQALPQPKGPNKLFSHISQTRLGSIQVFFFHSLAAPPLWQNRRILVKNQTNNLPSKLPGRTPAGQLHPAVMELRAKQGAWQPQGVCCQLSSEAASAGAQ